VSRSQHDVGVDDADADEGYDLGDSSSSPRASHSRTYRTSSRHHRTHHASSRLSKNRRDPYSTVADRVTTIHFGCLCINSYIERLTNKPYCWHCRNVSNLTVGMTV